MSFRKLRHSLYFGLADIFISCSLIPTISGACLSCYRQSIFQAFCRRTFHGLAHSQLPPFSIICRTAIFIAFLYDFMQIFAPLSSECLFDAMHIRERIRNLQFTFSFKGYGLLLYAQSLCFSPFAVIRLSQLKAQAARSVRKTQATEREQKECCQLTVALNKAHFVLIYFACCGARSHSRFFQIFSSLYQSGVFGGKASR